MLKKIIILCLTISLSINILALEKVLPQKIIAFSGKYYYYVNPKSFKIQRTPAVLAPTFLYSIDYKNKVINKILIARGILYRKAGEAIKHKGVVIPVGTRKTQLIIYPKAWDIHDNNVLFLNPTMWDDPTGNAQSICVDKSSSLTFSAQPNPSGQWPTHGNPEVAYPEWYIGGVKVADGTNYTFEGTGRDTGSYTITAKCGSSTKSAIIYVISSTYTVYVDEPDPGTSVPILISSSLVFTNFWPVTVGHTYARIHLAPSGAKNAIPFSSYSSTAMLDEMPVGFGPDSVPNNIEYGFSSGNFRSNDSSATVDSGKVEAISTINNTISGLNEAFVWLLFPGTYYMGTYSSAVDNSLGVVSWAWSHSSSRNCVTFGRTLGGSCGVTLPSGYGSWRNPSLLGFDVYFEGDSCGFFGPRL
jgi:hypothetical protein